MTIDELKKYCDNELKNIDRVTEEIFSVYKPDKAEYSVTEQAAIGALMMNVYTGIEKVLKQMLLFDKLDVTDSPEWHNKILRKAGEIGIIPPELQPVLAQFLLFRNFFIYNYTFDVKWEEVRVLVDAVKDLNGKLRSEIEEYLQTI
ncbi:MAG: hypothetical protein ISR97_01975 [Nitrospira sp.]|nr:hypothetical protein [Nitrospira sp.]